MAIAGVDELHVAEDQLTHKLHRIHQMKILKSMTRTQAISAKFQKPLCLSLLCAIVATTTTGCAVVASAATNASVTEATALEKTAKYFGVTEKDVVISSYLKGALGTTFQARTGGKLYNCQFTYGEVNCKQPGT